MGRAKQPQIRQRLLDTCTDIALERGLPQRLAPLAAAAGTSPRMLLYHFGTKDALLREVLRSARRRQREDFGALLRTRPDEPYPTTLTRAFSQMTRLPGRLYLQMFGRLREDAEQHLWPGFRQQATTDWLAPLEEGMASIGRPELASVVLAVVRGLIMDLEATADTDRVDRAFAAFIATLDASDPGAGSAPLDPAGDVHEAG